MIPIADLAALGLSVGIVPEMGLDDRRLTEPTFADAYNAWKTDAVDVEMDISPA